MADVGRAAPRPRPRSSDGRRPDRLRDRPVRSRTRRPSPPVWTKVVISLGAVVMVISGAVAVVPRILARWALADVEQRNDIPDELRGANIDGAVNFLLIGSDTRDDGALSTIANADSIMLVHIPATHDQAYMISIPRDLHVTIPRRSSSATSCEGGRDKINAAFGYGAVDDDGRQDLSAEGRGRGVVQTMRAISCIIGGGLKFNGWATVNFDGFDKVVEALGSVYLCIDDDVWSIHYRADGTPQDFYYHSGPSTRPQRKHYAEGECRDFLPWEALDYSRQRVDLGNEDGDYGRQRHQQQLMRAILSKVASADTFKSFDTIGKLQQAAGDLLILDLGGTAVEDWIVTFRGLRADDLTMINTYAGEFRSEDVDGVSYQRVDQDLVDLLEACRDDTVFDFLVAHQDWVAQSGSAGPPPGATG